MLRYLLKKILIFLTALFVIVTLTFFLMKVIPGDPFSDENILSQEVLDSIRSYYELDKPLYIQYLKYLKGFVRGNLGPSLVYQGRHTEDIIKEAFPVSALLGLEALFLSISFGIFLGTLAALKKGRWQENVALIVAIVGTAMPNFLLATLLQYIFSMKLDLLPVARLDSFAHTILPALSLSALPTAFVTKLTRANMIEILQQDFIKTAHAKGLSETTIIIKHALRNASLSIISYCGPLVAFVLTGSFVIEKIFGIPGLGQWLINSISNRDYPLIMGLTIFFSAFLMGMVLLVDIIYGIIDPRIKVVKKDEN